MRKTMLLLSGLPAAGAGTATMTRTLSVLLAFSFICGGSGSLAAPQTSTEPAKPLWQAKLSVAGTRLARRASNHVTRHSTLDTFH